MRNILGEYMTNMQTINIIRTFQVIKPLMYSAGYKLNEIYSFVKMFVQKDIKSMKNEVT